MEQLREEAGVTEREGRRTGAGAGGDETARGPGRRMQSAAGKLGAAFVYQSCV